MEECYIYQTEKGGGQIAFMVNLIDQSLKVSQCICTLDTKKTFLG